MNIAFFASGNGSNMQAIIDSCKFSDLPIIPSLVISNNSSAYALERAKNENIPNIHISSKNLQNKNSESEAILSALAKYNIDLIVLAGYMKKISSDILSKYNNKIINIHPTLLPKYGGEGMYGMNVHNAVFSAKEQYSGASVHFVTEKYDEGKVILQEQINIEKCNSPEEIAQAVLKLEHKIYWQAIKKLIQTKLI